MVPFGCQGGVAGRGRRKGEGGVEPGAALSMLLVGAALHLCQRPRGQLDAFTGRWAAWGGPCGHLPAARRPRRRAPCCPPLLTYPPRPLDRLRRPHRASLRARIARQRRLGAVAKAAGIAVSPRPRRVLTVLTEASCEHCWSLRALRARYSLLRDEKWPKYFTLKTGSIHFACALAAQLTKFHAACSSYTYAHVHGKPGVHAA
jgi:hypothetical protein